MDERDFEVAESTVAIFRDQRVRSIGAEVSGTGRDTCTDCDATISAERRQAAPFATRCIACQRHREREGRQYAR